LWANFENPANSDIDRRELLQRGLVKGFYGFVAGDTSQWQPNLSRNTTAIYPYVGNPPWNLTTAMADDAIDWLNQLNDINPSMSFALAHASRAISERGRKTDRQVRGVPFA
jgi:hypothetical protein